MRDEIEAGKIAQDYVTTPLMLSVRCDSQAAKELKFGMKRCFSKNSFQYEAGYINLLMIQRYIYN